MILVTSASATPDGRGELTNGHLCITGGTVSKAGTLDLDALPTYYGEATTSSVSGVATLRNKHGINADDCIRGIMEYKGTTYITKWRCP